MALSSGILAVGGAQVDLGLGGRGLYDAASLGWS